ncbi:unnamed protein product [Didymodactylos carnosus]|uniref:Uncharacterized protein n=1 Tax=Didymodactylos carnosus TaxID=1234261 RepID=A0A814TDX8_9BILA|nr:unnamed protein product [Didymodactylos carnosus]CAF1158804.1 unnamed protein product [Didymodactylos carnosus]CAF3811871.1 unnamed protein product [Didymodactylos carnosus]CAF3922210.1 unnamed protein product [Didymodactylos carnosus]
MATTVTATNELYERLECVNSCSSQLQELNRQLNQLDLKQVESSVYDQLFHWRLTMNEKIAAAGKSDSQYTKEMLNAVERTSKIKASEIKVLLNELEMDFSTFRDGRYKKLQQLEELVKEIEKNKADDERPILLLKYEVDLLSNEINSLKYGIVFSSEAAEKLPSVSSGNDQHFSQPLSTLLGVNTIGLAKEFQFDSTTTASTPPAEGSSATPGETWSEKLKTLIGCIPTDAGASYYNVHYKYL